MHLRGRVGSAHTDVEQHHLASQEHHASGQPVVTGVAVLERVSALQLHPAVFVACELHRRDRDRIVQQQQTLRSARLVRGRDGRFTFAADAEPSAVVLDPNTWMLMEPPQFVKK